MEKINLALASELYTLLIEKDRLDDCLSRNEAISHGAWDRVINDVQSITFQLEAK